MTFGVELEQNFQFLNPVQRHFLQFALRGSTLSAGREDVSDTQHQLDGDKLSSHKAKHICYQQHAKLGFQNNCFIKHPPFIHSLCLCLSLCVRTCGSQRT